MRIAVVGSGYVGLVAGACFADAGNRVTGIDNDAAKVEALRQGRIPIYEPGLAEMVAESLQAGRLRFSTDLAAAVKECPVIFIAVGTPPANDGSADMSAVFGVASAIADAMDGHRTIVTKSTVPVGTHRKVSDIIASRTKHTFDYVSNPEFLKEGAAIDDFTKPDRVVIGTTSPAAVELLRELYAPFMRKSERVLVMDPASAEMTKYAANAMLATRISFMNEIAGLCDKFGADVERVRRGIGSDSRIGPAFLFAGVGYGGSCFPKDVSALISMGKQVEQPMTVVGAVDEVNQRQRRRFAERVIDYFRSPARSTTLAVWGLAFKSRTDDVRESPAIAAVRMFLDAGMTVRAHDPEAMETARRELGEAAKVQMFEDGYEALAGADALVIFTDWPKFRTPDFEAIGQKLKRKVIFDGRNLYEPEAMAKRGFLYHCVGRPVVKPA